MSPTFPPHKTPVGGCKCKSPPHKRGPDKAPPGSWRRMLAAPLTFDVALVVAGCDLCHCVWCVLPTFSLSPFCPSSVLHPRGNCCRMVLAGEGRGESGTPIPPAHGDVLVTHLGCSGTSGVGCPLAHLGVGGVSPGTWRGGLRTLRRCSGTSAGGPGYDWGCPATSGGSWAHLGVC